MEFEEGKESNNNNISIAEELSKLIQNGDRKKVNEIMHTRCKCDLFKEIGSWPSSVFPILVYLTNKDKESALIQFLIEEAIKKINSVIGSSILQFSNSIVKSKNKNNVSISISVSETQAHGYTVWDSHWNSILIEGFQKSMNVVIPLHLKRKNLPLRRKSFEYFSTLTHELFHCLGMGHFPDTQEYRAEIMAPKRGGTIIPEFPKEKENEPVKAKELPELKKSPITIEAIKWVYNNSLDTKEGIPVYCGSCKAVGWKWKQQ